MSLLYWIWILFLVTIVWLLPIYLAQQIGMSKGRPYSWAWGFCLGWLGVIVVALLPRRESRAVSTVS
jgi:hypothetical protein